MKPVIVAFGGSFNPPTNSHFSLAEQIHCSFKEVDGIIFIPVSDLYPKKDLLEAKYRVEMLRLVCEKNPYFKVSTIETESPNVLNSIETLRCLQEQYKDHEIWLTLGTDNLKVMTSWPGYKEILEKFRCLVLERDEDCFNKIVLGDEVLKHYKDRLIQVRESIHSDGSATLLRNMIREGKSIRYMLPDEVYFYIKEKGLYTVISTSHD
nr:nicotinate (nicotinamide) nucleotide adenylyltransferase [uncultured Niameybacter sp.]